MSAGYDICRTCVKLHDPCDSKRCNGVNMFAMYKIAVDESKDNVKQPSHYTSGQIECIDAIRSALSQDEWRGYCKGQIMKYVWRERLKNKDEDVMKGAQYMEWLVNSLKGGQ